MLAALLLSAMLSIPHGQIAFVLNDGEQSDVYLIWADGRGMRPVTSTYLANEASPQWSPSGRMLAYSSNSEGSSNINLFLLDSGRTLQVSNDEGADLFPSFYPNGTKLTFERWLGGQSRYPSLIATTLYGTNPQTLLPIAFKHSWSKVSGQLLYITPNGMMVADREGHKNRVVVLPKDMAVLQAEWAKNDLLIGFVGLSGGQIDIFTVSANGSNLKNITRSNSVEEQIAWAPTGARIAYVEHPDPRQVANEQEMTKRVIRIIDLNTRKRTTLTDGTSECHSPTWSPDGTGLAFICCYVTTSCQLYVADVVANTMRPITPVPANISEPSWSPELVFRNN